MTVDSAVATIISPLVDTQLVAGSNFFNDLEVQEPPVGYNVNWTKETATQQGDLSATSTLMVNLMNLDLIEPEKGDPLEGQGTTDILVSVQDVDEICPADFDKVTIIRKGV